MRQFGAAELGASEARDAEHGNVGRGIASRDCGGQAPLTDADGQAILTLERVVGSDNEVGVEDDAACGTMVAAIDGHNKGRCAFDEIRELRRER